MSNAGPGLSPNKQAATGKVKGEAKKPLSLRLSTPKSRPLGSTPKTTGK